MLSLRAPMLSVLLILTLLLSSITLSIMVVREDPCKKFLSVYSRVVSLALKGVGANQRVIFLNKVLQLHESSKSREDVKLMSRIKFDLSIKQG